jgi:hypothetical protein
MKHEDKKTQQKNQATEMNLKHPSYRKAIDRC